jgi:6-pyruvoyltetrahydropterin/6-carboxytetrahydropterin synthase
MSINLKTLSDVIQTNVIQKIDHKNINLEVDFMAGKIASTEKLAVGIWQALEPHINKLGVFLHCIKIQETENNIVEYYGK